MQHSGEKSIKYCIIRNTVKRSVGSLHCKHMQCQLQPLLSGSIVSTCTSSAPSLPFIALHCSAVEKSRIVSTSTNPGAAGWRKARLDCVDLQLALVPLIAAPLHCLNSPHHHCSLTQHQSWTFSNMPLSDVPCHFLLTCLTRILLLNSQPIYTNHKCYYTTSFKTHVY